MSVFAEVYDYDSGSETALLKGLSLVLGRPVSDPSFMFDRPFTAEEVARVSALSGVPSFYYYFQSDCVDGQFGLIVVSSGSVVRDVSWTPEAYWESIKDDDAVKEVLSALVSAGFETEDDVRDFLASHLNYRVYEFLDPLSDYLFYRVLR